MPLRDDAVAEIDQTDDGTIAPVRSEWLRYQILAGALVLLFLIMSALSLRDPIQPINVGVAPAASIPAGFSLIDDDRLHAVREVYRLSAERVKRLQEKLSESEEARRRLEGDIQRALVLAESSVTRPAAPAPPAASPLPMRRPRSSRFPTPKSSTRSATTGWPRPPADPSTPRASRSPFPPLRRRHRRARNRGERRSNRRRGQCRTPPPSGTRPTPRPETRRPTPQPSRTSSGSPSTSGSPAIQAMRGLSAPSRRQPPARSCSRRGSSRRRRRNRPAIREPVRTSELQVVPLRERDRQSGDEDGCREHVAIDILLREE